MSKVRHIDFYPDEYIAGVGGCMTAEEQGIYWMICSLISSHGGEVDNDPKRIGRLVCLGPSKTKKIIDKLIYDGKLNEKESKLCQKRSEIELEKAQKRIKTSQENGLKGGRPTIDNKDLEKPDGLFPEKLTTNYQLPTTNDSYKKAFELWNDLAKSCNLPVARTLGDRKNKLILRIDEAGGIEGWESALEKVRNSPYLRGDVNGFRANLDFLLQPKSFRKVIEGNYDDQKSSQPRKRL